jgi:hypothetical protein
VTPSKTFWLTRDEGVDGGLAIEVEVWSARPERRTPTGRGVYWTDAVSETHFGTREEIVPLAKAKRRFRTIPETSMELIRIG